MLKEEFKEDLTMSQYIQIRRMIKENDKAFYVSNIPGDGKAVQGYASFELLDISEARA